LPDIDDDDDDDLPFDIDFDDVATAAPTEAPTAAPTEAPKPCPCDVCFDTLKSETRSCVGDFFQKHFCRAQAFQKFAGCWVKECIISTEACASRPMPDIDDAEIIDMEFDDIE